MRLAISAATGAFASIVLASAIWLRYDVVPTDALAMYAYLYSFIMGTLCVYFVGVE